MTDYLSMRLDDAEIHNISSLGLAHLGDAVYELMIRSWLCKSGRATAKGLHKAAIGFVSAPAQAQAMNKLMPFLTEVEQTVFRRGRNTRVNSVPKNSSVDEYHASTGFETLLGYLYLKGETARLNALFEIIIS